MYGDCTGHDLGWFKGYTLQDCQLACARTPACMSFNIYHDTCWLKNYACNHDQLNMKGSLAHRYYTKYRKYADRVSQDESQVLNLSQVKSEMKIPDLVLKVRNRRSIWDTLYLIVRGKNWNQKTSVTPKLSQRYSQSLQSSMGGTLPIVHVHQDLLGHVTYL